MLALCAAAAKADCLYRQGIPCECGKNDSTDQNASYGLGKEMHKWADARLSAGGTTNTLEVRITDAAITKKALAKQKTGIEGFFTKEQTEELSGRLAVDLKLYSPERTLPVAFSQVSAELSRTVREDASLEERKAIHRQIVSEIMQEVDKMLDRVAESLKLEPQIEPLFTLRWELTR